jgi:hypothetical protein
MSRQPDFHSLVRAIFLHNTVTGREISVWIPLNGEEYLSLGCNSSSTMQKWHALTAES